MILAMWLATAMAADSVNPPQVVGLKSGAAVQLRASDARAPGNLGLVQPQPGAGEVGAIDCVLVDATAWQGVAGVFGRVASGALPTSGRVPGLEGGSGCELEASFGNTPATEKVLTIKLRRFDAAGSQTMASSTTISRRESADLAASLSVLGSAAIGVEPQVAVATEVEAPVECADTADASVRILYGIKGWRWQQDPGYDADVQAVRRAIDAGQSEDDIVVKASGDRRLRPGTLGDLLGV